MGTELALRVEEPGERVHNRDDYLAQLADGLATNTLRLRRCSSR